MLDRASTFAEPGIVKLLQTRFVPLAIDQAYQRRQQDAEGDFYRKIASQGPRKTEGFSGTTQGLYIATAGGKMLLYNNNRDPQKVLRLMTEKLAQFVPEDAAAISPGRADPRYSPEPPEGGLVIRVRARVLGGYDETDDRWQQIFRTSTSRDNLWISRSEHEALAQGDVPKSLQRRLARYHLVDNTRGEPPLWREQEVREVEMRLQGSTLTGRVRLETASGDRGYEAELLGEVAIRDGRVVQFAGVALGDFWGEGPFTRGAPRGKFPLAISFTLADGKDVADSIPPQGSRGWVEGYLRP